MTPLVNNSDVTGNWKEGKELITSLTIIKKQMVTIFRPHKKLLLLVIHSQEKSSERNNASYECVSVHTRMFQMNQKCITFNGKYFEIDQLIPIPKFYQNFRKWANKNICNQTKQSLFTLKILPFICLFQSCQMNSI